MKRLAAPVLLFAVAGAYALAQGAPRMPVIPVDRGGSGPQPAPDPSGVYSGPVTFTFGTQSYTQTWRIPLKAQACPTCEVGQYVLSGTNYSLISYDPSGTDRGSVWALVNGDGTAFLELRGTNCSYITFGLGGASFYLSGSQGPSSGTGLRVSNGNITGRLSGYDCYGTLVVANLSLHRESGSQPQTCAYFGGIYFGSYVNSCGGSQTGDVILTQAGCAISGYAAWAGTAIQGIITSPTTATLDLVATDGCSGYGSGTAHISNGFIGGTYTANSNGGPGCCAPGPYSGSFTLSR